MDLGLRDRVALVLASTSGLGLATAQALAAEGARVAITGRRGDVAEAQAAQLPGAVGLPVDLSDPQAVASLPDAVRELLGPIDILVLNGPGPAPSPAISRDVEGLQRGLRLLFVVHVELVWECLDDMVSQQWGRILAIGSSGVVAPIPNLTVSNAARSALSAYLKTLASEVASHGITVNMLLPGRIATDRTADLDRKTATRESIAPVDVVRRSTAQIPLGRYGRPEEFGSYAAFLCSEVASYVTGSLARCDGGSLRSL